jgi:hypothetical protein
MFRQSIRSSKSLVLSLALSAFAVAGLAGCDDSEAEDDVVVAPDVQNVRVSAGDIAKLSPGQLFNADLVSSKIVYAFDYKDAPIDFSRIQVALGDGATFPIEALIEAAKNNDYGANPAPDLLNAPEKQFRVASNAEYFGILTQDELQELRTNGYFYSESPKAPSGTPQSTDNCIRATCVIHIDPATGGLYDWTNPPAYPPVVITEEHVWCE